MARASPGRQVPLGHRGSVNLWIRAAVVAVAGLTLCAAVLISSWSSVHQTVLEQKVKSSALVSRVAEKIGSYAEAGKLLDKEQRVTKLRLQLAHAHDEYKKSGTDSARGKVDMIQSQLGSAKDSLKESVQNLLDQAAAQSAAGGSKGSKAQAKAPKAPKQAKAQGKGSAAADQHPDSAGSLGFISGDRNIHAPVYQDGGYKERPFYDEDAEGESGIWTEQGEHPYDTYWGHHPAVHYVDDREVMPDGYGDHHGLHYDKGPNDHYGDFFHGRTDGYDWHQHSWGNGENPIAQYAWTAERNPVIGDEGAKRYRPLFYMNWDGSGRSEEDTKTMGEEDFFDVGNYARAPRTQGLAAISRRSKGSNAAQQKQILRLESDLAQAKGKLQEDLDKKSHAAARQNKMTALKFTPTTKKMSGLTMRQDRNGETADLDLGRYHGCKPEQIILGPGDDCDPLTDRMAKAVQKHQMDTLAQRHANNLGGVHWTSGDVNPREDAFPLREAHGGYSGIADIEYPSSEIYPTMYKPTLGLGPGDYAKAVTTKGRTPADLRGNQARSSLKGGQNAELQAEVKNLQRAEDKVKASLRAHANEERALQNIKAQQQKADQDVAIADQVMHDAMAEPNHKDKVKLLKAATVAYNKAANEKNEAKGAWKAEAKGLFAEPTAKEADQAEVKAERRVKDPVQRAQSLVSQEKKLRAAAKLLKEEEEQKVELAKQEKSLVAGTLASVFLDEDKQ